jgi:molybdenum cofactor cytidylyltransferase
LKYPINHICIIILAAGKSNRLGSPKQLLQFNGKGLLQNSIEAALSTKIDPVIVVTGANASIIGKVLIHYQVKEAFNEKWDTGMASSIQCGLRYAELIVPDLDGVLFMVCDQPFIDQDLLNDLVKKQKQTDAPVAACLYEDILGVPAIFHKSIFTELKTLQGDNGAKNIIRNNADKMATIAFQKGKIDIDTQIDYENLLKDNRN